MRGKVKSTDKSSKNKIEAAMNVVGEKAGHVIVELRLDATVAGLAFVAAISLSKRHFPLSLSLSLDWGF